MLDEGWIYIHGNIEESSTEVPKVPIGFLLYVD